VCEGAYDCEPVTIRDWRRPGGPLRTVLVDRCLAALVAGLNRAGVLTTGCCCGHRVEAGSILILGGPDLTIDSYGMVTRENPHAELREMDGRWWQELPGDPAWIHLGFAPTPRGPWRTFAHHLLHGLLMGYRWRPCLRFAWRHRNSFGT
jgi:hypothetical protein